MPLIPFLPEVDRMVWTVKQQCIEPAEGLTVDQSSSIMLYSLGWVTERRVLSLLSEHIFACSRSQQIETVVPLSQTAHSFALETSIHPWHYLSWCQRRFACIISARQYRCLVGILFLHLLQWRTTIGRISWQDRDPHDVHHRMSFRQRHSSTLVLLHWTGSSTSASSKFSSGRFPWFWQRPSHHPPERNWPTLPTFGGYVSSQLLKKRICLGLKIVVRFQDFHLALLGVIISVCRDVRLKACCYTKRNLFISRVSSYISKRDFSINFG